MSLDMYKTPAQKCNWHAIEALICHLKTNHGKVDSAFWSDKLFEVHCSRIERGKRNSTVTTLYLSLVSNYNNPSNELPSLLLAPNKSATTIFINRIDLDLNSTPDLSDLVSVLASNRTMKYMYLTHGPGRGDIWPIVRHCLDHATLEYIQVFERGSIRDTTLEAQVKSDTTQTAKRIRIEGDGDVDGALTFMLNHLTGHTVVTDLILQTSRSGDTSLPHSLFAFLESSTTQISRPILTGFRMSEDTWTALRQSIQSTDCHSLLLSGCTFDDNATADFVQTIGSVVRFLCLSTKFGGVNAFGQHPLETIYAELLMAKDTPLEYLRVNGLRSEAAGRVFRGLAALHSNDVQVKQLLLDFLYPEEITILGTLLPFFIKLQSLTVDGNTSGSTSTILAAFRQNGSLWEVKMDGDSETMYEERRMLDAYCNRNRMGPKILCNLENDDSSFFLVPTLFRLAQHAPRMAPNTILIGLLASKQSVPGRKVKRADHHKTRQMQKSVMDSASPEKTATDSTSGNPGFISTDKENEQGWLSGCLLA
jgi:hypothetical protein